MKYIYAIILLLSGTPAFAEENNYTDLPPHSQVEEALANHINVLTAETDIKIEQANKLKWQSGNYEFNVRAGTGQRRIAQPDQNFNEWDIAIERPIRLPNKMMIDSDIGDEVVNRAEQALGDAHHEIGRTLLHLWFNWQREQAQVNQLQLQVGILKQQANFTEKRYKAGDAPKMEWNQAQAAVSQAAASLQQAKLRMQLAGSDLSRQFPAVILSPKQILSTPVPIEHDFVYWKDLILDHNHEVELAKSEQRIQQMLAQRGRADRIPDPTVGLRYSNEMGGNEKITSLYLSIPLSFGLRANNAKHAEYLAEIANNREIATHRRLEADIYSAYTQAVSSYQTWQQAQEAADSLRKNAELITRAYTLGESNLSETLIARRMELESTLAENIARLDANETRYRLLLDSHQLWAMDDHEEHSSGSHQEH
jgi:outer membrane protein TolC